MNESPIIVEAESLLPQLDPAFERGCWLLHPARQYLSPAFHRAIDALTDTDTIACYASILDCMAGDSLRYVRNTGQRGFCMYFCHHPAALGRRIAVTAAVHEGAHFITDQHPSRDEPNEEKAIADWWANPPSDKGHSREWATAAMHLAYRAMQLGAPVAVDELLASAGLSNSFITDLRGELVGRADEPIEVILGSGSRQSPQAANGAKRRRKPYFPHTEFGYYGVITRFADGSVEQPGDLDGNPPRRFGSYDEFIGVMRREKRERRRLRQGVC